MQWINGGHLLILTYDCDEKQTVETDLITIEPSGRSINGCIIWKIMIMSVAWAGNFHIEHPTPFQQDDRVPQLHSRTTSTEREDADVNVDNN